jgi:hypothetical protein
MGLPGGAIGAELGRRSLGQVLLLVSI